MKSLLRPGLFLLAALLCGCSGSDINPPGAYVPKHEGTMTTVNGIDIYQDELPSRPYKVLTTVSDKRQDDLTPTDTILQAIAQQTRQARGDAAIILVMKMEDTGGQDSSPNAPYMAQDTSPASNSTRTITHAQVIVYLDKTAATAKPSTAPAAPAASTTPPKPKKTTAAPATPVQ